MRHGRIRRGSARGCPCPLAGRSLRPSRPSFTAWTLRFRPPGCACVESPLADSGSARGCLCSLAGRSLGPSRRSITGWALHCRPPGWAFVESPLADSGSARGCLCPLAGRSLRPSGPSFTAWTLRFRRPGCACVQSPLAGRGTPSLVNGVKTKEAGNGSDRQDVRCFHRQRGGRMPPMSTSGTVRTLASHAFRPQESRAGCPGFP